VPGGPSGIYYDAVRGRIWHTSADWSDRCGGLTVVAIDTTTDAIIPNVNYNVPGITPYTLSHDPKDDRMLVVGSVCGPQATDGGNSPLDIRVVELPLSTGVSRVLLDVRGAYLPPNAPAQPTLLYIDEHHAYVDIGGAGTMLPWDPTSGVLTATSPRLADQVFYDPRSHLMLETTRSSGTAGPLQVVSVNENDGALTTIGSIPNAPSGPVIAGAIWSPR
jgi:hypothetical protein